MSSEIKSENMNIETFIKSIKSLKPAFMSSNWEEEMFLENYNYILTDKAKIRLNKLYTYISQGIPVLLEGETGTSKTLSSEIICKSIYELKNQNNELNGKDDEIYIKFNLSAEVKINDLMQKFMGNKSSLSGLEIVDGPFLKAFKKGIPLILDEINLAPEEVLQSIEEALDSGEINMEISGIGNINCKKKDGFCLIATQNPNRDNYMNKRQELSKSFLSHFQIIKFPPFEIKELREIAKKLFKSFNNNDEGDEVDKKFITDLISFHEAWTSKEERKGEILCFTIREIAATVKAYIDEGKKNPFKIVKVIYASRYTSYIKGELLKLLGSFETFKPGYEDYLENGSKYEIPKEMKRFYANQILKEVLESSLFSLEKRRNIIIVGEHGIGKSHIAREVTKIFNSKNNKLVNNFYHFICTEDTKCSDLIGGQIPKENMEKEIYMEWKDGFLTKAIENGELVIMDDLQEANSTITERLNGLLDIKYDEGKRKGNSNKFDIPENPLKDSIEIHKDFRIIGICDIQSINQMSPAFLNRFDIIILENQLNDKRFILKDLLKILINRKEETTAIEQECNNDLKNYLEGNNEQNNDENDEQNNDENDEQNIDENDEQNNDENENDEQNNDEYDEQNNGENDEQNNQQNNEENIEEYERGEILDQLSIDYLERKILEHKKINEKESYDINKSLSLSDISRLCYSIKIFLKNKDDEFKDIPKNNIIDFIYELLFSEKDIKIKDNKIKNILLQSLIKEIKKKIMIKKMS